MSHPSPPEPAGFTPATSPGEAVNRLQSLYEGAIASLRASLEAYLTRREIPGAAERAHWRYPELRVSYFPTGVTPDTRRAYAKFTAPGVYATTVTQPEAFRAYLEAQLAPLMIDYGAAVSVGVSEQEIPYPFATASGDELAHGDVTAAELARHFPTPLLSAVGDEVADGVWQPTHPFDPRPLAMFDAVRVDFSLKRLRHYTGSDWRDTQPWILLTNYHRYVDQFVRFALEQLRAGGRFTRLVAPGDIRVTAADATEDMAQKIAASDWHRFQMPAYHLHARDGHGLTLVNIGVGPSNAKNITDHLAVLRPHCWLMIGHCAGLRAAQVIGDYVLAHAYLREDRILDDLVPPNIPIPALAEVQVALAQSAERVTGESGEELKRRLRTGTVVSEQDRNWELRWSQARHRINLSRAIGLDMESGAIAAQGYRLRVPYGTLLCVSDKPLHGEIKLPGAASAFYQRAVSEHLMIGIETMEILRGIGMSLHSRKLRAFDEPPFR
jgi:AMP nucleosidase